MNKLTIHYNSKGESGNIFWIIRAICEECKINGIKPTTFKGMLEQVLSAGSYEEALSIIREHVNLIDTAASTVAPSRETARAEFCHANETAAAFADEKAMAQDRATFVQNLGILLSQTREGIIGCELDENEVVTIHFKHGATRCVNVECDSYIAIIREVTEYI